MRLTIAKSGWLVVAALFGTGTGAGGAQVTDDIEFLRFPMVQIVSAAETPTVAYLVRQDDKTRLRFVRAPELKPVELSVQPDIDGQPISDIRISPDGKRVAFVTGTVINGREDGYNPAALLIPPRATVWLVDARAGAEAIRVDVGANPIFTPDSRHLFYRQGRDIRSVDLDGEEVKPGLSISGGGAFSEPIWTRDGKSMFFVQDRGGWTFLGQYELGSDRIRWLVTGADRLGSVALSPDGKSVAYLRWPSRTHSVANDRFENQSFSLETVDIESGAVTYLWRSADRAGVQSLVLGGDAADMLRWADDRNIVFRAEQDGWARLYAIARSGGTPRALTPTGCEVAESDLVGPDVLLVIHNCRDLDARQMSTVTVSTSAEHPIESAVAVVSNAAAIGDGRLVAYAGAGSDQPSMLRIIDVKTNKLVFIEQPMAYGYTYSFKAPPPRVVQFEATDGVTISGQLFLPATNGPHRALVYVHGGPNRQMFPAYHFNQYYAYVYAINRRLAELGFVVLSVNFRSGTGYGRDFREAAGRGWRGASEYQDVLGARHWLAQRSDVDPKRIGIWGGSYGGLLTAQALARNSELFSAGVAVHGLYDWSWSSAIPGHMNPSGFFGVGATDRNLAFDASPVSRVDGWTSPVLLFSGDQDMNVDVLETVDLTRRLQDRGVDVRTVIVPGEAHLMIRQASWIQLWNEQVRFFDEHL